MTRAPAWCPPRLCVVADLDFMGGDTDAWLGLLATVDAAAQEHPLWMQVRAKSLAPAALAEAARRARDAIRHAPAVLNGSDELAAALGYEGAHWPEATLDRCPAAATGVTSIAVHSLPAVRRAEAAGARALVFGAVWTPAWKPSAGAGIAALRRVAAATALPVFAIGGVTPARCRACRAAGARGVAVLSGVCAAPDPAAAVRRYAAALDAPLPAS